jgi:hypothetical protein
MARSGSYPIATKQSAQHYSRVLQGKRMSSLQQHAALQRVEMYCEAHPRSPSAVRRPRVMKRGKLWIVLLGANVRDGIVGLGPTVEAALRAFDAQYLSAFRPPLPA